MKSVGIVGLGDMGLGIAKNLLAPDSPRLGSTCANKGS